MSESAHLLGMLRRIRRRTRALAALEGAVAGAALGLAAVALALVVGRTRGAPTARRLDHVAAGVGAALLAFAALGALLAGARRISLVRCARLLDEALDRGGRRRDRVLSALSFIEVDVAERAAGIEERGAPLARAAVADAVARARALAPALVAPARRPRALPALGGAVLAVAIVAGWPARAPGARRDAGRASAPPEGEPRLRVVEGALEAERAELAAAAALADAAGDVRLTALAREARALLDALSDGALGRGDALDRLSTLATRAREAADEADGARAALRAAGRSLEATVATRALGKALGADDADATDRTLRDLAARGEAATGARADIAGAMASAARSVSNSGADDAKPDESAGARRHLDREPAAAAGGVGDTGASSPRARRLERLRRDLEATAAACRGDAAACAKRLDGARDPASGLPGMAREAREAAARRRLENAVAQARERLRRGELEESPGGASERRFARVARGEGQPQARAGAAGARASSARAAAGQEAVAAGDPAGGDPTAGEANAGEASAGEGNGDDDVFAEEAGAARAGAEEGTRSESAARGEGAGHEAGGEPLGRASSPPPTRGHEREVHVRGGAGPTRSEIIEASARRGFAARDYVRVFDDYQPVVEESLATNAVPEGRRYVVRRYFQLIRPRASTRADVPGGP